MFLKNIIESANTGLDAIQRAPIVLEDTGLKCLRIQDISQSKDFDRWGNTIVSEENYKAFSLKKDDIIIARTGSTIGVNFFVSKNLKSVYNNGLIRLRVYTNKALPYFVYSYLQTKQYSDFIESISGSSATQPNMRINDLLELKIPDKTLTEQQHIVDTIGSVDDLIKLNEKKILKLENILINKFNNFYTTKCNKIDKLGNIFKCLLGGTPNTSKPEFWDGSVNWINSGEVNNLRIYKPSKMITELGMNKSATKLLPKGTTVLAITGATLGQISLLEIDTCANQSVVGILENDSFGKEFIYPLMNYHIKDLISHQTGGAQPHINKDNIESLSIKFPSAEEYINYKNETRPLVELQSNLVLQNEKLKNIKERLLKKYFG